ncbi:MAG: twin-arginine translocase TatA/TatE family subunit [Alphaproteobacteria bacterium]|nr:twin-arginine translocase TatA/TatE family subunit [Alphaproteobacteria bacterium]MDP5012652.1 twin-arginine translocase TatA/TatE family subunit [Alphaproteobacteria bacterium]
MFDVTSYSPWLIVALVGLIIFRPDDWQELALNAGRWVRRVRAYVLEWQEYLEFTSDAGVQSVSRAPIMLDQPKVLPTCDMMFWSSKEMGGRIISVPANM